jgi:hypothetical protein
MVGMSDGCICYIPHNTAARELQRSGIAKQHQQLLLQQQEYASKVPVDKQPATIAISIDHMCRFRQYQCHDGVEGLVSFLIRFVTIFLILSYSSNTGHWLLASTAFRQM